MPTTVGAGEAPDAGLIPGWVSTLRSRIFFNAFGVVQVCIRLVSSGDVLIFPIDALLSITSFVLASAVAGAKDAFFDFVAR